VDHRRLPPAAPDDWAAATSAHLRRLCTLVARAAGEVRAAEVFIASVPGPSPADWLTLRLLAAELQRTHAVRVEVIRVAEGVVLRVVAGTASIPAATASPRSPRRRTRQARPARNVGQWAAGVALAALVALALAG